ncbi:MAG: hypothetical protein NTZ67_03975 [Gammaproteobacteria bacterium]|nr:hypothetical protein [Gammaproteobacteria bacterium]
MPPHHILTGQKHNEKTWDEVDAMSITDPGYKKRIVIFSQLVGWSQRNAAEPVKQDIRQGTYYLTEEKEPRSRPSRFNDWNSTQGVVRNSVVDEAILDSSVIDGIGYKFGAASLLHAGSVASAGGAGTVRGGWSRLLFKIYVEQKRHTWKTYCAREITSVSPLCGDVR